MPDGGPLDYVLGIDLGSNSLGWSVVSLIDDVPTNLTRAGVRVFEAGVVVDPKSGREQTRNADRRSARQTRRQLWRRRRRLVKVAHILQRAGLLPDGDLNDPIARQESFNRLDSQVTGSPWFADRHPVCLIPKKERTKEQVLEAHRLRQLVPYLLRAAGVEEKLPAHFVGRAIYHLAQRRGFWSNRKTAPKKDEKPSEVEQDIRTLRGEMGNLTLGQHFARLSPFERRIRDQWTSRDMYQTEFKVMWERQFSGEDTNAWRQPLFDAIFDQRPIKLKGNFIGRCEFEPDQRRAPAHLFLSQRFRLLQVVNNLKVRSPGEEYRPLASEKRTMLIEALERRSEMTFKEVRELLDFTRRDAINLQRDKEEAKMPGNDTAAQFFRVFGERWFTALKHQQDRIVSDAQSILSLKDADGREGRARKYLQGRGVEDLDRACGVFLEIKLEAGHRNLSETAMLRFMPLLEHGFSYGALSPHYRYLAEVTDDLIRRVNTGTPHDEACAQILVRKPEPVAPVDSLPPVTSEQTQRRIGAIRNPIVTRSLTELRKVVNAIVARFGPPTKIHIELLRDLKQPKDAREKEWKENLARQRRNESIEEEIRQQRPDITRVTLKDKEKYRLWKESDVCPYCQKIMTLRLAFGDDSEHQIDHIIPFNRSLDDSFANKVLCHTDCNRKKGQMTPYEKFGQDPERRDEYKNILGIVSHFKGDFRDEKLRRFKMGDAALEEYLAKRPAQQFNDSAYASRLAGDYLGLLYGGREDADGNLRVQVRSGGLTRFFREAWNLNSILGDGVTKNGGKIPKPRFDHRHHAIDAAVIAVSDQDMVRRLSDAAKRRHLYDPGRFGEYTSPPSWPAFREELKQEVLHKVVASHRVSHKISGALHKDTNYSKEFGKSLRRHRVAITQLSQDDVMSDDVIPDKHLRDLVRSKLVALGGGAPKKAFAEESNLPCFVAKDGRRIPVRKVRIQEPVKVVELGDGRFVKPGGNHHLEIFGQPGSDDDDKKWDSPGVVTMLTACERLARGEPVMQKTPEAGWEFRFSLTQGDTLRFDEGPNKGAYFIVRTISEEEESGSIKVEMAPVNDARQKGQIKKSKQWLSKSPNELRKWGARKVCVTPLGEVTEAHD